MKELEKEYQNAIRLEVPDLWSRIEAGVDACEEEKKAEAEKAVIAKMEPKKTEETKKAGKKLAYLYRFGGVAAAMFFLFLVVRTVNLNRWSSSTATSDTAYEASESMSEVTQEAASEEAMAEEEAGEATMETAEASSEETKDCASDSLTANGKASHSSSEKVRGGKLEATNAQGLAGYLGCDQKNIIALELQLKDLGIGAPFAYRSESIEAAKDAFLLDETAKKALIRFTDKETGEEYLMLLQNETDGTLKLLAVYKYDDFEDPVFEAE